MTQTARPQLRVAVYRSPDGWRWRLKAANGRILATGEAYTRRQGCIDGVAKALYDVQTIGWTWA